MTPTSCCLGIRSSRSFKHDGAASQTPILSNVVQSWTALALGCGVYCACSLHAYCPQQTCLHPTQRWTQDITRWFIFCQEYIAVALRFIYIIIYIHTHLFRTYSILFHLYSIVLFPRFPVLSSVVEPKNPTDACYRHTLVAARAIGGLCWGLAAVHYPTWVNRQPHEPSCMCDNIVFGFQTVAVFWNKRWGQRFL